MEGNVTVYRMLENFLKYQIKITKFGIIVLGDGTFEILFNRRIAKAIGKTTKTLRNWDKNGKLKYNKKGLNQLIDMITNSEVNKIVLLYKERLIRFGYELIENICEKYGTTIEIIDNTEKTEEQELVEDLIQIVTVFTCRLQGKKANKDKKIIKELLEDDTCKKRLDYIQQKTKNKNYGNPLVPQDLSITGL